jgi:MFS family permease
MSLIGALVTLGLPDVPKDSRQLAGERDEKLHVTGILMRYRAVLLRYGSAMLVLSLLRAARQAFIPLWCDFHGIDPSVSNVVYAISMGFELLFIIPGGLMLDRLGRFWGAIPTMVLMAAAFAVLPFTSTFWAISAAAAILGIGNGMSSGVVMTIGADLSPDTGRPQFLASWRLFADFGSSVGPLTISAVTAIATLAAASGFLAVIGFLGAVRLGLLLPLRGTLPSVDETRPDTKEPPKP